MPFPGQILRSHEITCENRLRQTLLWSSYQTGQYETAVRTAMNKAMEINFRPRGQTVRLRPAVRGRRGGEAVVREPDGRGEPRQEHHQRHLSDPQRHSQRRPRRLGQHQRKGISNRKGKHGCQIFRSYVFGPLGLKDYGSATLHCKI